MLSSSLKHCIGKNTMEKWQLWYGSAIAIASASADYQRSVNFRMNLWSHILGETVTSKIHSEIYQPLVKSVK